MKNPKYTIALEMLKMLKINADKAIALIENDCPEWVILDVISDEIDDFSEDIFKIICRNDIAMVKSNVNIGNSDIVRY